MPHTYKYPRAALTVDCVVFGFDEGELKVLLIERGLEPFKGKWALPGGFVRVDETLDEAARRELEEEAGLKNVFLEQLYSFGDVDRDPRERVVSVAYYALVKLSAHETRAATDGVAGHVGAGRRSPGSGASGLSGSEGGLGQEVDRHEPALL
jgi:8-oxo-dGTP diphosphatase